MAEGISTEAKSRKDTALRSLFVCAFFHIFFSVSKTKQAELRYCLRHALAVHFVLFEKRGKCIWKCSFRNEIHVNPTLAIHYLTYVI